MKHFFSYPRICTMLSFALLTMLFWAFKKDPKDNAFEIAKNIDIFTTLYKEVNGYYVDEVNANKIMRVGVDAMLKSLDPYTVFISEDQIEDYRTMTTGEYGGIGATIATRNGKVLVVMPFENSPARKSGLKIGDEILQIGEVKVSGKNQQDISRLLKGQANTILDLLVRSYGTSETRKVSITRERIRVDNVPFSGIVEEGVGYIHLSEFTQGATEGIRKALEELKNKGAKSLILDLRGNPGGLLHESVNICNLFINKDLDVVFTKGKIAEWNKTYKSLRNAYDTEIPLVVLTNNRSASASEIVSGVMQDYDRGVLMGQRSFGKGLVQSTRPLSYNSQVKVTVAKYYVPSGRCIQALDYANRDTEGRAGKIPDSLRRAFKTRNGRVVYDGAGLEPDIIIEKEALSPIAQSLISKDLIFNYANEYALKNKEIKEPKEFALTDAEYQAFVSWVKTKEYSYTTEIEKAYQELIEASKKDKTYDLLQNDLNNFRSKISKNKEIDLSTFKNEIRELLEEEISTRYYYEKGKTEAGFDDDKELKEAVKLLKDPIRYKKILAGKK